MRVISGTLKGRQIKPVPSRMTRPTADKVKEAMFQIIGPFLDGGLVLDLFAGSGNLGIEALSRGAERTIFVDRHPRAIQTIYENIRNLHIQDQAEVYKTDAFRALKAASKRGLMFDYIFLDPPYEKCSYTALFEAILNHTLIHSESIIICEHTADEQLPEEFGKLAAFKSEIYGKTTGITLYRLLESFR
ncbi:16S rRNA (guanine966-N2)-methyltransferase [Melghiribacillus thermohalophilus]|uniref:16S rRNA (Guanine966-N2)-methyltransferase n=1 Tax=Melghiribacillus thermohalophilus TaxID=1324956 RepID=A0A4R3NHX7_9BACI|nr:16S rRNA (guanine(966)-N(2))-methyltransferase RsmD [Melghiribacillus thermohalophilus]TCT26892.1 16S rRNA (guanine966-N2)-methyltransferase [Melghiribacillus thermohalophilus]